MESCKVYFWEIPLWNQTPKTCLKHFQTSTTKLEKKSQKKKKPCKKDFYMQVVSKTCTNYTHAT